MHNSKVCFKCGESQSLSEFYKHPMMADGHLNKCKSCTKKDTKANILKNHDYYIEYDKNRANLPHRIEGRKHYSQTDAGKAVHKQAVNKWQKANIIKRGVHYLLQNSIESGKLIKSPNCEDCKIENNSLHGHHDDYAYPLIVRWLCSKCHSKWHKLNGSGLNG